MWVLHLLSNENGLGCIRELVEHKNGLYLQVKLKQYLAMIEAFEEFNLLIIETDIDMDAFEELIAVVFEANKSATPIIAISDILNYLDTLINEKQTVEALKQMKIAVVDDSKFSLEIICGYFSRMGIDKVSYYQNSADLMGESLDYDLYLVDYLMPVFNGEDLIYKIRKENSEAIIILITAYGDGKTVPHCLSIGANDFLIKPLNFKLFTLRINAVVNQYRLNKENKKNHALLYQLATKDALTGIYNRAYFIESLKNKASEHKRNQLPLSLILLDLDHFKNINDEYGHQIGDVVLKETAKLLMAQTRDSDIVSRWGGEEFCIILSDASLNDAIKIAEKIRMSIAEISLYLAKLTGRNKVVCNEELVISDTQQPVAVEWGPFFRSGNAMIDSEHQRLIAISNEIIANCFDSENHVKILYLFNKLIEDTVNHFRHEEEILESVGYDKLSEHKRIHKDLVKKTVHYGYKV